MESIGQALRTLALVVPALAAPGPVFSVLSQQTMNNAIARSTSTHTCGMNFPCPSLAPSLVDDGDCENDDTFRCNDHVLQKCSNGQWQDYWECTECTEVNGAVNCEQGRDLMPRYSSTPAVASSLAEAAKVFSPNELRTTSKHDDDDDCTPGDRACYHSLDAVLVCNDDGDWVTYSNCDAGTFCHRLFTICVPENIPPFSAQDQGGRPLAGDKCKAGDRRCNNGFNRVDRCNDDKEWVTYHDCHKSEYCSAQVLECWPIGSNAPGTDLI